jgi:hypothetical protein
MQTMSKEKQIEEISCLLYTGKALQKSCVEIASVMYEQGFRKQSENTVEVVRCRDCKSMGLHKCRKDNLWHDDDDFCSRGERKK